MNSYVFFNYRSANGCGAVISQEVIRYLKGQPVFLPVSDDGYEEFFANLKPKDEVILSGGDGTLNRFLNNCEGIRLPEDLKFFPAGSGNDFRNDLGLKAGCGLIEVMPYMKDLPVVTVNGIRKKFFNGIGYGLDGYCCEVADRIRQTTNKPINYTPIALKGLLYDFKPANAVVTVDGKRMEFEGVWMVPTMKGRFFGGGMMITPDQDRNAPDHSVSVAVLHGAGRLKLLSLFPNVYKGTHVRFTDYFKVFTGHEITVTFDRPMALQIDGDTVPNVREYSVSAPRG